MKAFVALLLIALVQTSALAATTINSSNRFAFGANIGWLDFRADTNNGAVIGEFVCSGFIWGGDIGWINLGDGTPTNGVRYRNLSASDFGVNHDGAGNLSGFAWGENLGWLNFTNRDATGASFEGPKVDLRTGRLSGSVWSANCGWISLSNIFALVQTDRIQLGVDSDSDGIADAWELSYTNNLTTFTMTGDRDNDGVSDLAEYVADTNPLDASSRLRITSFSAGALRASDTIVWTSQPARQYFLQKRTDFNPASPWVDSGLGLISPAPTATTTRFFTDSASPQRFFRIQAVRPLP